MIHPHGTRRRYLDGPNAEGQPGKGCRCPDCTKANSVFMRGARRRAAERRWAGTPLWVDAEPVRQHVRKLMDAGPGWLPIADMAGLSRSTVSALLYSISGKPVTQRMRPENAAKLLALRPEQVLRARTYVDATGTRRRVQALAALGWTLTEQARRLGRAPTNMSRISKDPKVTAGFAQQVSALYDELSMTTPPDSAMVARCKAQALAKKWAPPLAWDDDTIDDPAAVPDLGAKVPRVVAVAENSEELERQGYTSEQVAERLGIRRQSLVRALQRARERVPA